MGAGSRDAMSETEQFSEIVGDIYDASLDPALWTDVLDKVCTFTGSKIASVVSQDAMGRSVSLHLVSSHDPQYRQLYEDQYFKINPIFPMVMFSPVEQTIGIPDVLPREEFAKTRFAREWLAPQGFIDALFTPVEKSSITCAIFGVIRHGRQGLFDDEGRRRFDLLVPHVRRAIVIGKVIDLKTVEAAALADSLDTVSTAMFLVDAAGRIAHANTSGHMMASEGAVVRLVGGKLGAIDADADQALLDAFTGAAEGDAALGRKGIAVPLEARDGTRYLATVLPLTSGARRKAGKSYAAVATVFIHKAVLDLPSPPEILAREFRLTPAELRVTFAIIEVGGIQEVAQVLGTSPGTVKTHLQHVFEKTGTNRQVDLVKLVAGYSNGLLR
jgi:DNA-binding CsgD family transcriptional regulator